MYDETKKGTRNMFVRALECIRVNSIPRVSRFFIVICNVMMIIVKGSLNHGLYATFLSVLSFM